VVQRISGVDPQVRIQTVAHAECSPQARIQRELSGARDGVSSRISPLARGGRGISSGVQKKAWRRGVNRGAGVVRPDAARDAGAAYRRHVDGSERQAAAGIDLRNKSPLFEQRAFPSATLQKTVSYSLDFRVKPQFCIDCR